MNSTSYSEKEKLWKGRDVLPLYNPKINIAQALLSSMTTFGPKIAQISDNNGIRMSFDDIHTKSIRLAQNLQARGYKPKQVFGIIAKNSHHVAPGVCLSHAAVLDSISTFNISSMNDVMLCFSSLYWMSGMAVLLKGTLCGSTRIITTDVFSPELQLRMIEQYKVTFTHNAPYQIVLMMNSDRFRKTDISSLKYLRVTGSKIPHHIKTDMKPHLPNGNVHCAYGMSEIGGSVSCDIPSTIEKDTVGCLVDGSCVKIVDDDGNRCGINTDGEICLKMNYKFLGYYGNQNATDDLYDAEGFLMTGDIGHFDEDGHLFVIDRKKDLLKYRGFQISPSALDAYLIESPHIKSACVVGIPDTLGDLPDAVIVRNNGSSITEKDVFDMIADHFADYSKLRGSVYFVDQLPTTPSGKVLRRLVKENAIALFNARNRK